MNKLRVHTPSASYPVLIQAGILSQVGSYLVEHSVQPTSKLYLITDSHLAEFGYSQRVVDACEKKGFSVGVAVVEPSDATKTLHTAERLYEQMVAFGLQRNSLVLALGGGMVGDLAGFVAATYYRGIPFIQLPTTLLAHDSSIGGKVGVNLKSGKNLVGAFHHPAMVLYDVGTLSTLPVREWRGGMAEVIKHGLIGDRDLFFELLSSPIREYPDAALCESLVARACQVKISIVERDEHESGERMKLNLGHTVGHAVEQWSQYQLNHGEAVSIGIRVEAEIALQRGLLTRNERDLISSCLQTHGLPVSMDGLSPDPLSPQTLEKVIGYLQHDKKHSGSGWTCAVPRGIGEVTILRDVTYDEVVRAFTTVHNNGGTT